MIPVDDSYALSSEKTAKWAEKLVRKRFRETHGEKGDYILDSMKKRKNAWTKIFDPMAGKESPIFGRLMRRLFIGSRDVAYLRAEIGEVRMGSYKPQKCAREAKGRHLIRPVSAFSNR